MAASPKTSVRGRWRRRRFVRWSSAGGLRVLIAGQASLCAMAKTSGNQSRRRPNDQDIVPIEIWIERIMSIDIRHIQAFITVANELHFGRAATRLNIAQPALSRTVQHLELLLGVQLLERTTRNVQLTEAGRTFQEQGSRVLHQLNQ